MTPDSVVILSAMRTPIGAFQGALAAIPATSLGSAAIRAAAAQAGLSPHDISGVAMGCVLPAGLGQAPARQATLGAGLPETVPASTVNKVCGSGLKAVTCAHDALLANPAADEIHIAGGMESMSRAPYLLLKARGGYRAGHGEIFDHMFMDGLEDAYERGASGHGVSMGVLAERCAAAQGFTRQAQDAFALASLARAKEADFTAEITEIATAAGPVSRDELPQKARPEKIPALKPAFAPDGTITAANASAISDGAAALVLCRESHARRQGMRPLVRIVAHATHAGPPANFPLAPIGALRKLAHKTGWDLADVDLFEINEAFAVVVLAAMRDLGLSPEKVNVKGGACALGHPIGASGARVLVTLVHALIERGLTRGPMRGMACLCIGGGEAIAIAVERDGTT